MSERAVVLLQKLGYSNVRDYREGLADWVDSSLPVESVHQQPETNGAARLTGPQLNVSPDGYIGRGPARVGLSERPDSVLELVDRLSTFQLFLVWIGTVMLCGFGYWIASFGSVRWLVEQGSPIKADLSGLGSAVYFSFVTATSVGYGDIVPVGFARVLAVIESVTALLVFGAVIAKFVSHRQEEVVLEIHRVTFDERLDRVQSNLHLVISELLSLNSACETRSSPMTQISTRLDSAVLLFVGELRTTHDLLYQPRLMVEEAVLSSILANLASALDVLVELLTCLPAEFARSEPLEFSLRNASRLAQDICGNCVPHSYTPRLNFWMDRIQNTSRRIQFG